METSANRSPTRLRRRIWSSAIAAMVLIAIPFLPIPLTVTASAVCAQNSADSCEASQTLQWVPLYKFLLTDD